MGRKINMGYGLTQLWDWNKNVIDFIEDVSVKNRVMVIGFKT